MKDRKVIIIAGPTAVGKTGLAIQLASRLKTAIISADSRQCYRELRIGVARPTPGELATVPHYFIASHSITENITAADFESIALRTAEQLFQQHDTIVMTGGTGLYLRAFANGLDAIPTIPAHLRENLQQEYETKGKSWLQETLQAADPEFYSVGEIQNPQRMLRALEVMKHTGKSILYFRKKEKKQRPFNLLPIALELPREQLNESIDRRVDQMIKDGLEEEVRSLVPFRDRNALQTVGYKEFFDCFDGKISKAEAIIQLKQHTRQYAKRQMTWFKKDTSYQWAAPDLEEVQSLLKKQFDFTLP